MNNIQSDKNCWFLEGYFTISWERDFFLLFISLEDIKIHHTETMRLKFILMLNTSFFDFCMLSFRLSDIFYFNMLSFIAEKLLIDSDSSYWTSNIHNCRKIDIRRLDNIFWYILHEIVCSRHYWVLSRVCAANMWASG